MRNARFSIMAALGTAVVLGLALMLWLQGPERHADGAGPFASLNGPGSEAMKAQPISGVTSWTYGLRLCLAAGSAPAILESVSPTVSVGTGYRFLGAGVREWLPTQTHTPIIGVSAWPPPVKQVPDAIHAVRAFAVTTPCSSGAHDRYTELLIGLGLVNADGGGWQGLEISYHVNGRHRVVALDHDLEICGRSVNCGPP
jgi:hypothetical protein